MRHAVLALTALIAAPLAAHADDLRPFCADRPGKATPPCILDAGHLQVETALADAVFLHAPGQHEDVTAYGATELRFGLTGRLEIEAAWAPLIVDHARGAGTTTGVGDATFGFRYALTDAKDEAAVQVSIQPYVNAPTATHGLGQGGWTGGVRLPVSAPLPDGFSLGFTPQVDLFRNGPGGGTHVAESATVSISRGFGDTTLGAELWGQNDGAPHHMTKQATFDLFAAQLIGKSTQLDGGVNLGLNHDTPTSEVYVGLSHRF
ncbi:MAG: transporter [Proteobacteria bacterium]|nr:transporter [Pseudomonadota bacterium]